MATVINHPKWKLALWARDFVEPTMLRVPVVIILFIFLWALNLWILDKLRVPHSYVLPTKPASLAFALGSAVFLATMYAVIMTIMSNLMGYPVQLGIATFYSCLLVVFMIPKVSGTESLIGFFRLLKLTFIPNSTITFPEVLLADALTSVSKVMKDFGTTLIVFYAMFNDKKTIEFHNQAMILTAVFASIPFMIRVRQCSIQMESCTDKSAKIPIFLNICKYITGFPPIWLTAAASTGYMHPLLPTLITIAASVNSVYSYLWDIMMDWGLIQIKDWKLVTRQKALLPIFIYILAPIINLILRFSWTINRIPGMNLLHSSVIILIIEIGEVFRRALWNILRIEWEVIVQQEKAAEKS